LARTETRITLEEWLKRLPRFTLDPKLPVNMSGGIVGSVLNLPLQWNEA
jgi:cytochrome P450